MIYWFRHAVEEESHADAAREKHEEPRDVVVLRDIFVFAEFDTRILGKVEPNEENRPNILRPDVEPSKNVGDPRLRK